MMKNYQFLIKTVITWVALCMSCLAMAMSTPPLSANDAFTFSTYQDASGQWLAEWQIAPQHYLYRDRLRITVLPPETAQLKIILPPGETKQDSIRGTYQAYAGHLQIPLPLQNIPTPEVRLRVDYQGCSQEGFCYPPMHQEVTLVLATTSPSGLDKMNSFLTSQTSVQNLLQSYPGFSLLLFIGLGLLLALTPCVLPMVPILASLIMGQKHTLSERKGFFLALTYVLGMAFTYAGIGFVAAILGQSLQVWLQTPWIIATMSGLFVLLAFSLLGLYELKLPHRWSNSIHTWSNRQTGGRYVGVFMMGILSTLIVSPCVTAPLVGVLLYIGQTGDVMFGASALFMMGLGMGIPLLLMGFSAGKWLPKRGPWMEAMKKGLGIAMLGMAVWLFSRIISESATLFLWGIFLLITALFFTVFLPRLIGRARLHQGLGFIVGVGGIVLVLGATVAPGLIDAKQNGNLSVAKKSAAFIVVQNEADLNKQLAQAKALHQPVLLDFYADWCEACVVMDRKVFNVANVQQALANYVLLRIDLSANSDKDELLMKRFAVMGPPTMLFFDKQGHEMTSHRMVGGVGPKMFVAHLTSISDRLAIKK